MQTELGVVLGCLVVGALGVYLGHRLRKYSAQDADVDEIEYQAIRYLGAVPVKVDLSEPERVRRLAALSISILPEDSWEIELSHSDDEGSVYWTTHRLDKEELLNMILPGWYDL